MDNLGALERRLDDGFAFGRWCQWSEEEHRALIQRLREAEAKQFWAESERDTCAEMRVLERTTAKARITQLERVREALSFKNDLCRGCGVDRTGDWQGEHRSGCWVRAALAAVKEKNG